MKFKIAKTEKIKNSLIKKLSKLGDYIEEDNTYIFENVENEDMFLYEIAKEINNISFQTHFKKALKEYEFNTAQIKRICKNHETKTFEFNHFEFLLKTKLFLYFLNENTLNIGSFIKFNSKDYIEELLSIAELEGDLNGELLEEDDENSLAINDSDTKRFQSLLNLLKTLMDKNKQKEKYEDFHVYYNKNKFKVLSESNKEVTFEFMEEADKLYTELSKISKEHINYDLFLLSLKIGYFQPSRIILYKSLEVIPDYFEIVLKDFGLMKQVMSLKTDVFKSSEDKPRL